MLYGANKKRNWVKKGWRKMFYGLMDLSCNDRNSLLID